MTPENPISALVALRRRRGTTTRLLAADQAAALLSLRRSHCLPELVGCCGRPDWLVDGLARDSALEVLRGWRLWLPLWLVALLPVHLPLLAPLAVLAQAAGALWLSYLAQLGAAWSEAEDDFLLRGLLGLVSFLVPVFGARQLAIWGLLHYEGARTGWRRLGERLAGKAENAWVALSYGRWMDNPIVFREVYAAGRRTPGGLIGLLARRHGWMALALGSAGLLGASTQHREVGMWTAVVLFFLVQTLRAGSATIGSLVDEREGATLEGLLLTPVSRVEWADGWAVLGSCPRLWETAAAGLVLTAFCPWRGPLAAILVAQWILLCAYRGVILSSRSSHRAEAQDGLGLELAGLWAAGIASLLLALFGPWQLCWPGAALGGWLLAASRRQALGHPPVRQSAPAGSKARVLQRLREEGLVRGQE